MPWQKNEVLSFESGDLFLDKVELIFKITDIDTGYTLPQGRLLSDDILPKL
jgi:hypothetical protein